MIRILICNQKGGVGKSLIADELAYSFERSNIPCAFIDLDQQGGTKHRPCHRSDADVVIVDTPGALQEEIGAWMRDADIIIIPIRPTSRDIPPLLRMQDIASSVVPGKAIVYVINCYNRFSAASDFREWMESRIKPDDIILTLVQSEMFVQADAAGESVVAYSSQSNAAIATLEMVNAIRRLAGFDEEYLNK